MGDEEHLLGEISHKEAFPSCYNRFTQSGGYVRHQSKKI